MRSRRGLIEYDYTLIPAGTSLTDAPERRMEKIIDEYNEDYADIGFARKALKRNNCIDKYALRRHWKIVRLDVSFANEPWDDWSDLKTQIYDLHDDVLYVENKALDGLMSLFVSVSDGAATDVANKIRQYYSLLEPVTQDNQVTICPETKLINLEEQF